MRNLVMALLVSAVSLAPSVGLAAETTGVISRLDAAACKVTLKHVFVFSSAKCEFAKLKVGDKVTITFDRAGNILNASAIVLAK
jgi:Cu/Ag efflux protein CusF